MTREKRFVICNLILPRRSRRGQIWVETVIYTLIAFTLIGLVLAFVKPEIEEIQDRGLIEQSIKILEEIDSIVSNIGTAGNQRVIQLGISKGTLNIDGENDKVFFNIDSRQAYSEPGKTISSGNIDVYTVGVGSAYNVNLTLDYTVGYNITFQNSDSLRRISKASTPYRISISNEGTDSLGDTIINFDTIN
ncbi:MAG: hypothetical protein KJ905_03765 [Nanoarchaeota archaeon]|nr:hypothetical protein [Nanoarchaeota archaeon]MBU1501858.1 hypothetical protein [Nanoarchaeota archaeon]MBU2458852.1 hypothetical protein [Nanoarchaeota archaeon]